MRFWRLTRMNEEPDGGFEHFEGYGAGPILNQPIILRANDMTVTTGAVTSMHAFTNCVWVESGECFHIIEAHRVGRA